MQNNVEESLNRFSKSVLDKAFDVRRSMEQEMSLQKDEILKKKELEFLEEAYHRIQSGIARLHRESNEHISKTILNNRKGLILKREEVVNEVFNEVLNKIKDFAKSQEYYKWLLDSCKSVLDMISAKDGSAILYINKSDERWQENLNRDMNSIFPGTEIVVEVYARDDFIGGAKALNPGLGIEADNSIKSRLEEAKHEFLKLSGLFVD
jgi:vacuolar-type H+-ATPase subunit E/Vma4